MDSDLKLILASSSFILLLTIYWCYKNFIAAYSQFPSCHIDFKIIYCLLTRKYPKHLPFTSFIFQEICTRIKMYSSEGVCLLWMFRPFLCIFGEEAIKTFSQEPEALDKSFQYKVLEDVLGKGVGTSNGDTWKVHRKMCNPAFRLGILKGNIPIFNKHASAMVKKLTDAMKEPSINLEEYILHCSLDIICESLGDFGGEENSADMREFHFLVGKLSELTAYRILHPVLHWKCMLKFSSTGRMFLRYCENLKKLPRKIVMRMKEDLVKSGLNEKLEEDSHKHKSLTQMLLEIHMKDPTFTIQNVWDELQTFLIAGYDTTATTLGWCIFMLGVHQDLQEQVYNEMKPLANKNVSYEDLTQLTYLDCFIKETLRLYPTIPAYGRRLNKDIKCGKYNVLKGTNILFMPYVYHRNPSLYPDPERFDPDRFRDGRSDNRPWTHITFSEGMRNCIGKKFALLEVKVILVHILTTFKVIALDRREDVDIHWEPLLRSVRPLRTKLKLRQ